MNEPMSFTGLGYFLGYHAPGRKGLRNFSAAHHAALCQAEGGRIVRANVPEAYTGTALSCAHIKPINKKEINIRRLPEWMPCLIVSISNLCWEWDIRLIL